MRMCPKCAEDSDVTDSREGEGSVMRRRRRCKVCEHRWTTYEVHVDQYQMLRALEVAKGRFHAAREALHVCEEQLVKGERTCD